MDNFDFDNDFLNNFDPNDLISEGLKLIEEGKFDDALQVFDLYLLNDPWNALVINNKADCYLRLKKLDEALDLVYYALMLDAKFSVGWCTLGEIQASANEKFCARLNIGLALELTPEGKKYHEFYEQHIRDLDAGKALTSIPIF